MKILMTEPLQPVGQDALRAHPGVELVEPEALSEDALIAAVQDVEGIAVRSARLTPAVIAAATALRAVSRHGVGFDNIHVASLSARNIPLLLAIHANAVSVAEHTMYFLLSLAKRGRAYDTAVRQSNFSVRTSPVAVDIAGKVLTVIGFGRIGSRLAPRALAFDMRVNVYDPYVADAVIADAGCTPVKDFRTVLGETDFLSVHCPLNDETRHMIGAGELRGMRPDSFVINCARGGIVDEAALVTALASDGLAGAGIDVFETEPPLDSNPLLEDPRILLSPHSAGVSVEAARRMSLETAHNLLAALGGELPVEALANPEIVG